MSNRFETVEQRAERRRQNRFSGGPDALPVKKTISKRTVRRLECITKVDKGLYRFYVGRFLDRSKLTPHQGWKEMERRRNRRGRA